MITFCRFPKSNAGAGAQRPAVLILLLPKLVNFLSTSPPLAPKPGNQHPGVSPPDDELLFLHARKRVTRKRRPTVLARLRRVPSVPQTFRGRKKTRCAQTVFPSLPPRTSTALRQVLDGKKGVGSGFWALGSGFKKNQQPNCRKANPQSTVQGCRLAHPGGVATKRRPSFRQPADPKTCKPSRRICPPQEKSRFLITFCRLPKSNAGCRGAAPSGLDLAFAEVGQLLKYVP